jgi:hypothetical protein
MKSLRYDLRRLFHFCPRRSKSRAFGIGFSVVRRSSAEAEPAGQQPFLLSFCQVIRVRYWVLV